MNGMKKKVFLGTQLRTGRVFLLLAKYNAHSFCKQPHGWELENASNNG